MRWILTVLILVALRDFYALQLMFLYVLSLTSQYLHIHVKPMQDRSENYMGVFNEFTVQIYIYLMISLSEYNGANQFRAEIGFGLVAIILLSLAISFIKFLF
jgi:Na+-translocating ferredoxin:NAD+ oxidoreductase RnfA subunit